MLHVLRRNRFQGKSAANHDCELVSPRVERRFRVADKTEALIEREYMLSARAVAERSRISPAKCRESAPRCQPAADIAHDRSGPKDSSGVARAREGAAPAAADPLPAKRNETLPPASPIERRSGHCRQARNEIAARVEECRGRTARPAARPPMRVRTPSSTRSRIVVPVSSRCNAYNEPTNRSVERFFPPGRNGQALASRAIRRHASGESIANECREKLSMTPVTASTNFADRVVCATGRLVDRWIDQALVLTCVPTWP
jgi:hypothetical protein